MRDSVPSGSYSSVCNVLRQWKSRSSLLIESTDSMIYRLYDYRVYRLYDIHLQNEQKSRDAAAIKYRYKRSRDK